MYYFKCRDIIKQKRNLTRWCDKQHTPLAYQDYFVVYMGKNDFLDYYQARQSFSNQKGGQNTYDIETLSCVNHPTGQCNAMTFSRKIDPSVNLSFVRRQPGDVKKVSIASYTFNDFYEPVLVNNFDPQGHPHDNNFSIYNDYEKPYYEKYFGSTAPAPHFHFNTQKQDIKLKRPNAISVENIAKYLEDLDTQKQDVFLQTETMGMPFLKIKNGDMGYRSVLFNIARKYCQTYEDDDITEFFFKAICDLKSSTPTDNDDYIALKADINALKDFKKAYPKHKDIISDFGFQVLSSLNQGPDYERKHPESDMNKCNHDDREK